MMTVCRRLYIARDQVRELLTAGVGVRQGYLATDLVVVEVHRFPVSGVARQAHACPDVLIGQGSSSGCRHRALRTRSATWSRSERAARR